MPYPDVLVIGAGLAGLVAARSLRAAGRDVVVLEARDRVGGRMWSRRAAGGACLDLGAQWIGPGQRRMYALAGEFSLHTIVTHVHGDAIVDIGAGPRRQPDPLPPLCWLARLDALQLAWRAHRLTRRVSVTQPWLPAGAARLDAVPFTTWLRGQTFTGSARAAVQSVVEASTCTRADGFSALELFHQLATVGGLRAFATAEREFFADGAQTIALRLAAELGERVRLRCPVRAIRQEGDGARVSTDGGEHRARRIVLATPLHMRESIRFDPALPDVVREGVGAMVRGQVMKFLVVYERAWWRDVGLSGTATSPNGPFGLLIDGSPVSGRPGVLVGLAAGPHAAALGRLDDVRCRAALLVHVEHCFGASTAPLLDIVWTDWSADPWACGGYAARRGVGWWTRARDALIAPCGRIHFAGTETATEWRGYMEGAAQSAERVSAEVIGALDVAG